MIQRGFGFVGRPQKRPTATLGPDVESTFAGPAAWALFRQISLSGFMCSAQANADGAIRFSPGLGDKPFEATTPISTCCCARICEPSRARCIRSRGDHDCPRSQTGQEEPGQDRRGLSPRPKNQRPRRIPKRLRPSRFRCRGPGPARGRRLVLSGIRTGAPAHITLQGAARAGPDAGDIGRRYCAGQTRDRGAAQPRCGRSDADRVIDFRPSGAQARGMEHPARRRQWCRILALRCLHRRQSDLAERSHVPSPRRGDAVGRGREPRESAQLLQRRAAALRQGPPGTGACLARGG